MCWALLTLVTGGIALPFFSSRNPRNPTLAAAVLFVAAWSVARRGQRWHHLITDLQWTVACVRRGGQRLWLAWNRLTQRIETLAMPAAATAATLTIAAGVLLTSLQHSPFVAAASDSWGYVSQAEMWATWTFRTPQPLMVALRDVLPSEALAPLAYRPSLDETAIVPVTSPGLPMLMGLLQAVAGRPAVFAVVPLLAAVAVWATYVLGRAVNNRWTGVVAAAMLATSPAFLFQLTSAPMSDIPAAAFWTLSLAAAIRRRSLWSGVAAGIAVLIRANLAPLAIVPAGILVLGGTPDGSPPTASTRDHFRHLLPFAAGVIPAAAVIAVLYTYWYGSPIHSGYGTLEQLYSMANVGPNLARYGRWLLESQTPLVFAGLLAPWLVTDRRGAVGLLLFCAAVLACYVLYIPFDAWWFLRFLLPAFPALLVLTAGVMVGLAKRLPPPLRVAAVISVVGMLASYTVGYATARATFNSGGERKYAITGRHIADHLPDNAVIFAEIHSGSIRYYSGRPTIRFGLVPSDHLEGAIAELQRLGYQPYLVAEDWEEDVFRTRFAERAVLSALDAGPHVELPLGNVRIYPLAR